MIHVERKQYELSPVRKLIRERLEIRTDFDHWNILAVRVNGLLLDVVPVHPNRVKYYALKHQMLPADCEITVEEYFEDIDLTLPENCHMRDFDYFRNLFN